jgi:hypothetical protein
MGNTFPEMPVTPALNNNPQESKSAFNASPFGENWDKKNTVGDIRPDSPSPGVKSQNIKNKKL